MNQSVLACSSLEWHLEIWDPEASHPIPKHLPWSCRSWRHKGECRQWKGAQDFARVAYAIKKWGDWVYIVLTFDPSRIPDPKDQYKKGVELWSKLRKRMVREYGAMRYIQTWERFQRGGAHVNLIVNNDNFFQLACENWQSLRRTWLEPHAVASGFGFRTWVEPVDGTDGMAGYLTKLSRELTGSGEKNQIPIDAPAHFRRIRSSQRTLPPPLKSKLTGRLRFCSLQAWLAHSPTERLAMAESSGLSQNFSGTGMVAPGKKVLVCT